MEKTRRKSGVRIADMIIPVFGLVIFIILLYSVLIPTFVEGSKMMKEADDVQSKINLLNTNKETLKKVNTVTLQKDLTNSKKIVPNNLEVADFAFYVDSLAKEKKLEFQEIAAGDLPSSFIRDINVTGVEGVNSPMAYKGTYNNIARFLDELQGYSPYIVSSGGIEIAKVVAKDSTKEEWRLEINVTGYYLKDANVALDKIDLYQKVNPYSQRDAIVKLFEEKANRIK